MVKVKVDRELLLKVAANARIKLSEEEVKRFLNELEEILKAFSKLDEVNIESTKPSFHSVPLKNVFKEDKVEECLSRGEALQNTKHKKQGYFVGPKVV